MTNNQPQLCTFLDIINKGPPKDSRSSTEGNDINSKYFRMKMNIVKYKNEIQKLITSREIFSSNFIPELEIFWISSPSKIYLMKKNAEIIYQTKTKTPVITAFLYEFEDKKFIVLTKQNSVSILEFHENSKIEPVTNLECTIPKNVVITCNFGEFVGCEDGTIRKFSLSYTENKNLKLTIDGSAAKTDKNPIRVIFESSDHIWTLQLSGKLTEYKKNLSYVNQYDLGNVSCIHKNHNSFLCFRNTCSYYSSPFTKAKPSCFSFLPGLEKYFGVETFSNTLYTNGLYACHISNGFGNDKLYVMKVEDDSKIVAWENQQSLGKVYSISSTKNKLSFILLTSAGIATISEVAYEDPNFQDWFIARNMAEISSKPFKESKEIINSTLDDLARKFKTASRAIDKTTNSSKDSEKILDLLTDYLNSEISDAELEKQTEPLEGDLKIREQLEKGRTFVEQIRRSIPNAPEKTIKELLTEVIKNLYPVEHTLTMKMQELDEEQEKTLINNLFERKFPGNVIPKSTTNMALMLRLISEWINDAPNMEKEKLQILESIRAYMLQTLLNQTDYV